MEVDTATFKSSISQMVQSQTGDLLPPYATVYIVLINSTTGYVVFPASSFWFLSLSQGLGHIQVVIKL